MRLSQVIHKIPDVAILATIAVGVLILHVYLISSIGSFKHEISDLKEIIQKMRVEQREAITTTIREDFYLQELKGNVYYNDPYYAISQEK